VSRTRSVIVALLVAFASVGLVTWYAAGRHYQADFDGFFAGAVALRRGLNPYETVGPGHAVEWWTPLYYPAPALVLLLPLTPLSLEVARCVFVGLSTFILGYALARQSSPWLFMMLASQAYISCVALGQWSILLLAAFYLPWLRGISVAKPNLSLPLLASSEANRNLVSFIVGVALMVGLAFMSRPSWFGEWRHVIVDLPLQRSAIFLPGGIIILASLLRWRRPEARYLAALALVPQTPGLYSDLLLFAVPRGKWEVAILALLSHVAYHVSALNVAGTAADRLARYGALTVPILMLPCLIMVLRRPNAGEIPAWIDRLIRLVALRR